MSIIYEPSGRAREYAALAANLYSGCEHGCLYCYAPNALRRDRAEFHAEARPRADVLKQLDADCRKLVARIPYEYKHPRILMSFSCDPYGAIDEQHQLTRQAIEIMHAHSLCVQVLTKGGRRACRDFDLLSDQDAFASTLTFLDPEDSQQWEPRAALPEDRLAAMQEAHRRGIPTWASLEPVIDPEQSLQIILDTQAYVDLYKVGMLNHHPLSAGIDWAWFGRTVKDLLESLGKPYYLKRDLCEHAGIPYRERTEAACRYVPKAPSP